MIENILILLLANTLLPYIPIHPLIFLPTPLVQFYAEQPSAFANMNLSRLHTSQDFKKAFRNSLKLHHPDHGGSQEVFSQIRNLKKIMEQPINYYDVYNITDADLQFNQPLESIVALKEVTYSVEVGLFYFITLLYVLAFTINENLRPSRKYLLPLVIAFGLYEYYIHTHPQYVTIIDLLDDQMPIFVQVKFLKRTLGILIAIIRVYFQRKPTNQTILLAELEKEQTPTHYRDILAGLQDIYTKRCQEKQISEKSWLNKIRGWVSKGLSLLFFLLIIRNFIPI